MIQVQTLLNAAQFDIKIPLNLFERYFLARFIDRKINFAKSTNP